MCPPAKSPYKTLSFKTQQHDWTHPGFLCEHKLVHTDKCENTQFHALWHTKKTDGNETLECTHAHKYTQAILLIYRWPLKKRRKRKTIKCINWVNHVLSLLHILPTSSPPHSVAPFLSGSVTRVLLPCLACDSVHCSFSHPSLVTPPPPTLQLSSYRSLSSSFTLLLLHLPIFLFFTLSPPPIFKSS